MNHEIEHEAFRFGPFYLDSSGLLFDVNGRIPLEPIQSSVLRTLLQYGGRIVTKSELIENAWHGGDVSDESISRAVYKVRKALGKRRDEYIEAVSGKGYRFVCLVEREHLRQKEAATNDFSLANSASAIGLLHTARAMANDLNAMMGYWDLDLRCRYANPAYEVWFGRSQAMMLGISMPQLLGPLFAMNLAYINGVKCGQPQHFRRLITLPNGVVRSSLASYFPDLRDGKVCGFSVLVIDAERFESR
jgi:DNA-binding winged helix-turn-helix (wHTH) protein